MDAAVCTLIQKTSTNQRTARVHGIAKSLKRVFVNA